MDSLLLDAYEMPLPYDFRREHAAPVKVLRGADSLYLVEQLYAMKQHVVNDVVSSAFGMLDCEGEFACFEMEDYKAIHLMGYTAIDKDHFLLHLQLKPAELYGESYGLLLSVDHQAQLKDWLVAYRSTFGNPNGTVRRQCQIRSDSVIEITESSWGRNNISYTLQVEYKIFPYVDPYDDEQEEEEEDPAMQYYLMNHSEAVKQEYFDLSAGEFELITLHLDI